MLDVGEVLWLILAALGLGVTLPVMIQLFLLIRQSRQTMARLSGQIEPGLRMLNDLAQRTREPQPQAPQLAAILATLIPAIIAGYRAFRHHPEADISDSTIPATIPATTNVEERS